MPDRIYLDNAATSWPKPESVYSAVDDFHRKNGAASGRGAYDAAMRSGQIVSRSRTMLKQWLGADADSDLIFTFNGTDGLNLCLFGLLKPGDHIVTSIAEHNSILRPLAFLAEERGLRVSYVDTDEHGLINPDALRRECTSATRLVALTHASNVTGCIQPIADLGTIAHENGARFLVDAAQTIGHVPICVSELPVDMLAASGHKGLMAPLGTGLVYLAQGMGQITRPLRFGGTGTNSQSAHQPTAGPERFESGNLNLPGIAGILAAVQFQMERLDNGHIASLTETVIQRLSASDRITVYGPTNADKRVGLVSFTVAGYDCHDVAAALDAAAGIEVRAGLHCAPMMHKRLGVSGTVRASWGEFSTTEDVDQFVRVLGELCKS